MTIETETELRARIEGLERVVAALIAEALKRSPTVGDSIGAQWSWEGLIGRGSKLAEAWIERAKGIGLTPFP